MSNDIEKKLRELEREVDAQEQRSRGLPFQQAFTGLSLKRLSGRFIVLAVGACILLFLFQNLRIHLVGVWLIPWWLPLIVLVIVVLVVDHLWNRR